MSPIENNTATSNETTNNINNNNNNETSSLSTSSKYRIIAWDLDTTGRRLIDEICHIGGHYLQDNGEEVTFSQYVMPYKNPNPGARRSFGIRVVNFGRYRMLKDVESGKILQTKSEITALQEFLGWLKTASTNVEGVVLVCHESTRKVLIPLLLEALYKYNLMDSFNAVVKGMANGVNVVEQFGNKSVITSNSLRSLCKTVLNDTNPKTSSASDRSKVLMQVLKGVAEFNKKSISEIVVPVSVSISTEEAELKSLKTMLITQGTLRPIFESLLAMKRPVRERAIRLRKIVVDSGHNYEMLDQIYKSESSPEEVKKVLSKKFDNSTEARDIENLITLLNHHFLNTPLSTTILTNNNQTKNGN